MTSGALAAGAATLAAPARAQETIKWRMQTYAGPALAEHVAKPAIDAFNAIANGQMEIELFYADQLVPTSELFRAMQSGTIDAVQSDDDSMASPTEVTVFGGYFPLALRYSLDVPALFNEWGLNEIWDEEYSKVGVKHISAGSWDPCHFAMKEPVNSLADLQGKRVFTFPTAGRFLAQFGVVPVTVPWEDVEVAMQTGELDGIAWSGITEDYTVGWSKVAPYFLTNNISGAWIGSHFVNPQRWADLPEHLKQIVMAGIEAGHTYRNQWYWGGEARLRAQGDKLKLRSIPQKEWKTVEDAAVVFWDEMAQEGEVAAKIVQIFRDYNEVIGNAGPPYTFD
jgi:TRAP-type mannitol/chloroaromatic compound transport system substrate-binding protein